MPNVSLPKLTRLPYKTRLTFKPRRPRRPRWLRGLLLALALPPCAAGLFCLTTAYKIYASNQAEKRLAAYPNPASNQRLLVFAPHPDDETLGAAGLMRQARLRGDDVRVVIITNGDGFRISASQEFRTISVTPKDFVRYAYLRQGEARTALGVLGIPPDHIHFLGYPGSGLDADVDQPLDARCAGRLGLHGRGPFAV